MAMKVSQESKCRTIDVLKDCFLLAAQDSLRGSLATSRCGNCWLEVDKEQMRYRLDLRIHECYFT